MVANKRPLSLYLSLWWQGEGDTRVFDGFTLTIKLIVRVSLVRVINYPLGLCCTPNLPSDLLWVFPRKNWVAQLSCSLEHMFFCLEKWPMNFMEYFLRRAGIVFFFFLTPSNSSSSFIGKHLQYYLTLNDNYPRWAVVFFSKRLKQVMT